MFHLAIFFITLLILVPIISLFRNKKGITNWPIVGMTPALVKNVYRFHNFFIEEIEVANNMNLHLKGPWFSAVNYLLTVDPSNVQHILCKQPQNYIKGSNAKETLEIFGDGIINVDFSAWKYQKKVAQSFFHHPNFYHSMVNNTFEKLENRLIPFLDHVSNNQIEIDLQDVVLRFMYDTISTFFMSHDPRSLSIDLPDFPLMKFVTSHSEMVVFRNTIPPIVWKFLSWLNIGIMKKHKQGMKVADDFIYMCIDKKREEMKKKGSPSKHNDNVVRLDLLSFLLMDNNQSIDLPSLGFINNNGNFNKYLRDTLSVFFFGGVETTAAALSWFFYLLSKHPEVESKIKVELEENNMIQMSNELIVKNFKELSDKLIYLHASLCETLRLYPSIPTNLRTPIEQDVLPSGHRVTPSTRIAFNSYAMGRMKLIWGDNCNEFKPERWIDEKGMAKYEPPYKFSSFGAGPRICLGKGMAMTQLKLVAAIIMQNYHIEAIEGLHEPDISSGLVLRMKNGFKVKTATGSLYFWAAHLAGPKWGPFASFGSFETIGLIAALGLVLSRLMQERTQVMQHIDAVADSPQPVSLLLLGSGLLLDLPRLTLMVVGKRPI